MSKFSNQRVKKHFLLLGGGFRNLLFVIKVDRKQTNKQTIEINIDRAKLF